MADATAQCAKELMQVIPGIMDTIRHGMRRRHGADLTQPQFRTLALVSRLPGASLAQAAAHVGLGAPAMSVQVDGLVRRGLLRRDCAAGDRRKVRLDLTPEGRALLLRARAATRRMLAERLSVLSADEIATVSAAVASLQRVFTRESTVTILCQRKESPCKPD